MQKTFSSIGKLTLMAALACLPVSALRAQTAAKSTVTTETINFGVTPTTAAAAAAQANVVPDLYVTLGDSVTLSIRSFVASSTPIELYFLVFDTDGMPIRKLVVGNVKNPQTGVYKRYKIMMNQSLLDTVVKGNAEYMRAGYCIGGCGTPGANKLIKGKVILPQKLPLSSDSLAI